MNYISKVMNKDYANLEQNLEQGEYAVLNSATCFERFGDVVDEK